MNVEIPDDAVAVLVARALPIGARVDITVNALWWLEAPISRSGVMKRAIAKAIALIDAKVAETFAHAGPLD